MALFIVVLLNINSYAAVGANDGSAFVTKAEFDALINTFNEQMDTYQSGLNTKIDGAIANYLAGLSTVNIINQTSMINNLNLSFVPNWQIFDESTAEKTFSSLGDMRQGYLSLVVNYYFTSSSGSSAVEWRVLTGGQDSASTKTMGSTYSYYILSAQSSYDSSKYTITGKCRSFPSTSATMSYSNGSTEANSNSPGSLNPSQLTRGSLTSYGTYSQTFSGTIFGQGVSGAGSVSISADNTVYTDTAANKYVSGGGISTARMYHVLATEINMINTTPRYTVAGDNGWRKRRTNGSNNISTNNGDVASSYVMNTYDLNYKTINAGVGYTYFINDAISSIAGEEAGYFNGLPLFKASNDGKAKLNIVFNNSSSGNNKFEVREGKFDNADIAPGFGTLINARCEYVDDAGNIIKNIYSIPSGKTVYMEFNCKKNKTYWIKVMPESGACNITSESIAIEAD